MSSRIQKKEVVRRIANRMAADEKTAEAYLDATLDTLYEAFKAGEGVTLPGFGGFYVKPKGDTWVFKFNPSQKLRALFGWSSTYTGKL
jgi:DNA-binding protein HU-beta